MKLPEYDNRPSLNTPLYSSPADGESNWPVLKGVVWFAVLITALGIVLYVVASGWRDFF
jgi:hypothetical protein